MNLKLGKASMQLPPKVFKILLAPKQNVNLKLGKAFMQLPPKSYKVLLMLL